MTTQERKELHSKLESLWVELQRVVYDKSNSKNECIFAKAAMEEINLLQLALRSSVRDVEGPEKGSVNMKP